MELAARQHSQREQPERATERISARCDSKPNLTSPERATDVASEMTLVGIEARSTIAMRILEELIALSSFALSALIRVELSDAPPALACACPMSPFQG